MFDIPTVTLPDIPPAPIAYSYSDTQFDILKKYIVNFENSLDSEHEVGIMLTNFGQSVTMQVTQISYEESVLMVFKGHVSQLNFLLTSIEKEPDRPKRTIGFVAPK